jgi:hypothetical protein
MEQGILKNPFGEMDDQDEHDIIIRNSSAYGKH